MELLEIDDPDLINCDLAVSEFIEHKQWNIPKLRAYINIPDILHKIIGIPIPVISTKDSFCWSLSSTGRFTTTTWLAQEQSQAAPLWSFKWIWQIDTMPKIQIFLWQMCHNTLPVKSTLLRRGCQIDPQCPLCQDDVESSDHLFSKCSQTTKVWDLAKAHQWIPLQVDTLQASDWLPAFELLNHSCNKQTLQRVSFLVWRIWKMRNAIFFQRDLFQPLKCLE